MDSCLLLPGLLYRLKGPIFSANLQIGRGINGFMPSFGCISLQVKGIHFCNLQIWKGRNGFMPTLGWIALQNKGIHFTAIYK